MRPFDHSGIKIIIPILQVLLTNNGEIITKQCLISKSVSFITPKIKLAVYVAILQEVAMVKNLINIIISAVNVNIKKVFLIPLLIENYKQIH